MGIVFDQKSAWIPKCMELKVFSPIEQGYFDFVSSLVSLRESFVE